jgi:hypothetical protein
MVKLVFWSVGSTSSIVISSRAVLNIKIDLYELIGFTSIVTISSSSSLL